MRLVTGTSSDGFAASPTARTGPLQPPGGGYRGHATARRSERRPIVEDLSSRSAQEVLDDHLNIAQNWGAEEDIERVVEEDMRRNVSEDIVVLINRGVFRGHEGVMQLAQMLGEELPEHNAFEYTFRAAEGKIAMLEWAYEDTTVRVRDGVDSYLIEGGKIVAQTIHYTLEQQ